MPETTSQPVSWWRTAAIYQIYMRSFADGNGDGVGDLAGIRSRLPYLRRLGVDAVWLTPWFVSPMADAGYDVADYRDIDPLFGTLAEAVDFIAEAHQHGIRVIIDLVPNHCSDAHPWFQAALSDPDSAERGLFWFKPGRGAHGGLPPNDWQAYFGGDAWTRTTNPDGTPGDWYLHMFTPEQPDLNWDNPVVCSDFEDIVRFWLDRGVDGLRIDVAHGLVKKPGLPDAGPTPDPTDLPYQDVGTVHDIYRSWRRISDTYPEERIFVGEVWLPHPDQYIRYLRPDELHSAFNFDYLCSAFTAPALKQVIDQTLATHEKAGAPPTWVLSNHDTIRHVTRYGREDTTFAMDNKRHGAPTDFDLGTRRARAAALLTFALPGGVYLYQGDELGLPEVEDIPAELLQDPTWHRSGYTDKGRDGCRVPLPWSGDTAPFGFSTSPAVTPWLPQPDWWKALSVEAQQSDPASMLSLYRTALGLRKSVLATQPATITWLDVSPGVLAFSRGDITCVLNLSTETVPLPRNDGLLLASGPSPDGQLTPDTCAWLRSPSLQQLSS